MLDLHFRPREASTWGGAVRRREGGKVAVREGVGEGDCGGGEKRGRT